MPKENSKITLPKPAPKPSPKPTLEPGTTIPLGSPNDRGSRPNK